MFFLSFGALLYTFLHGFFWIKYSNNGFFNHQLTAYLILGFNVAISHSKLSFLTGEPCCLFPFTCQSSYQKQATPTFAFLSEPQEAYLSELNHTLKSHSALLLTSMASNFVHFSLNYLINVVSMHTNTQNKGISFAVWVC